MTMGWLLLVCRENLARVSFFFLFLPIWDRDARQMHWRALRFVSLRLYCTSSLVLLEDFNQLGLLPRDASAGSDWCKNIGEGQLSVCFWSSGMSNKPHSLCLFRNHPCCCQPLASFCFVLLAPRHRISVTYCGQHGRHRPATQHRLQSAAFGELY
ncbi:hypothetical protein M432DRAFT_59424 [Thermoascus aurantiacus ATCC 26904]